MSFDCFDKGSGRSSDARGDNLTDLALSATDELEVIDPDTGEVKTMKSQPAKSDGEKRAWYGCETPRSVKDAHRIMTMGTVIDRTDRMRYGGVADESRLRRRSGEAMQPPSAEDRPPVGWAGDWYWKVVAARLPATSTAVARQLARLARDGREVNVSIRSLADAVGEVDRLGRLRAFTETGVEGLRFYGFVEKTVTGRGRGAKTNYRLELPW